VTEWHLPGYNVAPRPCPDAVQGFADVSSSIRVPTSSTAIWWRGGWSCSSVPWT